MARINQRRSVIELRRKETRRRTTFLAMLGSAIVIATAIALMVPAISVTQDKATPDQGFYQVNQIPLSAIESADVDSATDADSSGMVSSATEAAPESSKPIVLNESDDTGADEDAFSVDGALEAEGAEGEGAVGAAIEDDDDADADVEAEGPDGDFAPAMPAQNLKASIVNEYGDLVVSVDVEAPEGALPEGASVIAEFVADENVLGAAREKGAEGAGVEVERMQALAVNITFQNASGEEIEPARDVRVTLGARAVQQAVREASASNGAIALVHLDDKSLAEMAGVESLAELNDYHSVEIEAAKSVAGLVDAQQVDVDFQRERVAFESSQFSVYAIVYTVDFHYEANGRMYSYGISGGGFVSLSHLLETLGIATDDPATSVDEIGSFVTDIANVEFSNPDLAWVGKTDVDATIAELKVANSLACDYSAGLSDEAIAEIDAQMVAAGDWVLISLHPFTSQENMVVTMGNGDHFVIGVTDAQINPDEYDDVIYTYTVNDTEAGIIQLVNSSGNPSGQDNEGTTVTDDLNPAKDKANRFAMAVPNEGYRFVRWTNDGRDYKNGANNIRPSKAELTNGEYTTDTFVANFVANGEFLINFATTEGGSIRNNLTSLTYSEIINTSPDIFAVPDSGYRCLGWRDQYGQMVTTDRYLYSSDIAAWTDGVYTAVFEEIEDKNIYYRANGTYGTVSTEHEIVHGHDDPIGSVATPHDGYQFISWVDEHGETVWPLEDFVPYSDYIYDGATYIAVFESAAYSSYFMMQADDTSHGHIESPQYENGVNGRIVSMYIRDNGTIPAALAAVANEGWLFDHWEVNGVELEGVGDTIPAGYDFSGFELWDGWNILIAYYEENPVVLTHTITYKANTGGTVRGLANTTIGDDYVDQWLGTNTSTVRGATASANTNWTVTGWLEQRDDGSYKVVSTDSTFVPSGELLKDATYYAAFRTTQQGKGMVGYNMNITDVPVKWNGVQELVIASGVGAPMYYDTNGGNYFARGDGFSIDLAIPEAEGYYFLGWYNKDRNAYTSTQEGIQSHPATSGDIIPRGSNTDMNGLVYSNLAFNMNGGGSRYTFEAMFAGINAASKRVPYDGATHQLIGAEELFKGTVGETERFRTQLAQLEQNGGYRLDPVKYQLMDENGNPVGEPTSSFERVLPGTYSVRVYADGIFAGQEFTIYKDVTLEIYPAKVVIKKYWLDDSYSVRPEDLDISVLKYDTKTKGVVSNPDTNVANRNRAQQNSENITQSSVSSGTNVASILSGYEKDEPDWEKHGSVWTKEYDDVLVRNIGYSETDQASGYDLFFAEEVVPTGYRKAGENWVRTVKQEGSDFLTTTIEFRNEYLHEPLTLTATKQWAGGGNIATKHPSVTFYLMRSVNGAPFERLAGTDRVIARDAVGDALTVNWVDLPQKNSSGTEYYTYKIAEVHLDGFETEIVGTAHEGYVVTNTDGRISLPVLKLGGPDGSTPTPLGDAEFTLYKLKDSTYQRYIDGTFPESPYVGNNGCVFVSDDNGQLTIEGLSDGVYMLEETKAPAGYVTNGEQILFTVSDSEVSLTDGADIATYEKVNPSDADKTLVVTNEPGKPLPQTGGFGTIPLYVTGLILVIVACSYLAMRRLRPRRLRC